ncbi:MAG: glycosyltransferase family 39 protein [Candidatus Melainabacteria bacterium]|nr:glycosyltransferase family 39 protein [Candidatus Melainabacteria bacterium]
MFNHRNLIGVVVTIIWLSIAINYCFRSPYDYRGHDIYGQLEYSEFIAKNHKLPTSNDCYQCYHPPLYYIIANLITPSILSFRDYHINFVRGISVFYGTLVLWIILLVLEKVTTDKRAWLMTLLFIETTPAFVFIFSRYNNDSLLSLLSISALAIVFNVYFKWSQRLGILLFIVAAGCFYTKYTAVFCMLSLCLLCCKNFFLGKLLTENQFRILRILFLAFLLYSPWLVFHNYRHFKKITPLNFESRMYEKLDFGKALNTLSTVVKIPILQSTPKEWSEPWAHSGLEQAHEATKRNDFFSFSFVTSIIGECSFDKPAVIFFWALLLIHLIIVLFGLKQSFKSNLTKLALSLILLGQLTHLSFTIFMKPPVWGCTLDYRYICWSWLPWAVLYASALSDKTLLASVLKRIFVIGITIQVYILLVLTGPALTP